MQGVNADFQQGMESVSLFKMNTATENYKVIYASAMVIELIVMILSL